METETDLSPYLQTSGCRHTNRSPLRHSGESVLFRMILKALYEGLIIQALSSGMMMIVDEQ